MSKQLFTRVLNLSQSSGKEININLFLPEKPVREKQKLKTLIKYIQKYPSGWKRRLELADLLFGMGRWAEAIEQYRLVVTRQPQLITVKLKLAKILQLMEQKEEAIAIYEQCVSTVDNLLVSASLSLEIERSTQASKFHILGLIGLCRQHLSEAVKALTKATQLEPNNPSHWLALGKVQVQLGNNLEAVIAFNEILSRCPQDLIALLDIYDALITLDHQQSENLTISSSKTLWFALAETRLNQAIAIAPNDYQVLRRRIIHRCDKKQVLGKEGKETKKLINLLGKMTPNLREINHLNNYYNRVKKEIETQIRSSHKLNHTSNPNLIVC